MTRILVIVIDLPTLGCEIAARRKALRLTQTALGQRARVSRATIDALENGRTGELGFSKINRLVTALGMELTLRPASSRRPTLDELLEEDRNAEGVGGRG